MTRPARHRYWPIFDLRLSTPDLELRPLTEADTSLLADLLPPDVELNPAATRYPLANPSTERGIVWHQSVWQAYAEWTPEAWRIPFGVWADGSLVGEQDLEASDFLALRTVDSFSFLIPEVRGRGWGKQMRRAVLTLAFDHLDAEVATTSAWADNTASLGVSRAVGYQPNGERFHRRAAGRDTMTSLRLLREAWTGSRLSAGITVEGVDGCLALFGLPSA